MKGLHQDKCRGRKTEAGGASVSVYVVFTVGIKICLNIANDMVKCKCELVSFLRQSIEQVCKTDF